MSPAGSKLIVDASLRAAAHLRSSVLPEHALKTSAALFSAHGAGGAPSLPDLKYDYGALEPTISAETMTIHHTKHHNTYVTNLTAGLEQLDAAVTAGDVSKIVSLGPALKFNGGGHVNHSLFWDNLSPTTTEPTGALATAIDECFGSVAALQKEMTAKSVAVQGSGWGWLGYNTATDRLEIATCANQDPLQATTGLVPLVGIDVWEHAYYVDYRNVRPDYVNGIWKVIDWNVAGERFAAAK